MQSLNLVFPDKEDFKLWLNEVKQELIHEIKREVLTNKEQDSRQYMTRAEIAKKYRISLVSLGKRDKEGLPSIKMGKRRLYDPQLVEAFIKRRK